MSSGGKNRMNGVGTCQGRRRSGFGARTTGTSLKEDVQAHLGSRRMPSTREDILFEITVVQQ